ncbi:MAG: XdhC family protein [Limisphaerales bacterium]
MRFYQQMVEAAQQHKQFALGIISRIKGSTPQKKGAKALFFPDDTMMGTLGGGCLEAEVRRRAKQALATGKPETFEFTLDHNFGWDDGLICGGKVYGLILPNAADAVPLWSELAQSKTSRAWIVDQHFAIQLLDVERSKLDVGRSPSLYEETVSPAHALWIAGSGHVAQAVAPLAINLDFEVTVFDDRPELANYEYFPKKVNLRVGNWGDLLATPFPPQSVFGLVATRGHNHDADVLADWIHKPFAFLGMIGSTRKFRLIGDGFIEKKIATPEQLTKVACPVGLPIKAVGVNEIAVSVMAQMIEVRAQATA